MSWLLHPVSLSIASYFALLAAYGWASYPRVRNRRLRGDATEIVDEDDFEDEEDEDDFDDEEDEYEEDEDDFDPEHRVESLGFENNQIDELDSGGEDWVEQLQVCLASSSITFDKSDGPEPLVELNAVITSMPDGDSGKGKHDEKTGHAHGTFRRTGLLDVKSDTREVDQLSRLADSHSAEFRCIGCDTYERGQGEAGELGESAALALLVGNTVRVRVYGKDDYGRLLVVLILKVTAEDGTEYLVDWSKFVVAAGFGIRYAGSKHIKGAWYERVLDPLQKLAMEMGMGVWGWPKQKQPLPPHVYRNGKRGSKERSSGSPLNLTTSQQRAKELFGFTETTKA